MIDQCTKMAKRAQQEKDAEKIVKIRGKSKENVEDKQPKSLTTLFDLHTKSAILRSDK